MATWKKVVISGSDISQLNNDSQYLVSGSDGVELTGSFSGSFEGDGSGLTGLATNLDISGSTGNTSVDLLNQDFTIASGNSISTEATNQTITVAVTDGGIGETQLGDGAVTTDKIADASITGTKISGSTVTNDNLENDSVFIGDQTIELGAAATTTLSGLTVSGSFSGSFEGDGSGLTGIVSGTGVDNQVATWNGTDSISGSANFTYDGTTLTVGSKATIGTNNLNTGTLSTIAGGTLNTGSEDCIFIGGGSSNSITGGNGNHGVIVGGNNNTLSDSYCGFIGGGSNNCLTDAQTNQVIVGGTNNAIVGSESGILGGTSNYINGHNNSFIIGSNLTSSADCTTYVNNLDVEGSITGSSFTGSFVGDGSGLTGVSAQTEESLLFGDGLLGGTFDGTTAITASINLDGSTLEVGASGLKVSSSGITETELNASVAGTGLSGGAGTALSLDLTEVISTDGENRILTSDGDGTLTAEPNFTFDGTDLTVTGNQLVTGDLTVQGTASFQHTEEYQVADRFILMASGSSTEGDGGIVIQQGTQNVGEVFGFDSATTRFGLTGSFDASTTAFTPDAFMAAVVVGEADELEELGDDPDNAPARYQAKGNIFVGTDEGIWIYS